MEHFLFALRSNEVITYQPYIENTYRPLLAKIQPNSIKILTNLINKLNSQFSIKSLLCSTHDHTAENTQGTSKGPLQVCLSATTGLHINISSSRPWIMHMLLHAHIIWCSCQFGGPLLYGWRLWNPPLRCNVIYRRMPLLLHSGTYGNYCFTGKQVKAVGHCVWKRSIRGAVRNQIINYWSKQISHIADSLFKNNPYDACID